VELFILCIFTESNNNNLKYKIMSEVTLLMLETLNGIEVSSINYEGVIGIKKDKVYRYGEIIDTLDTDLKVSELWDEYKENEGF